MIAAATTNVAVLAGIWAGALCLMLILTGVLIRRRLRGPMGDLPRVRRGALNDFETMFGSTEWRTYLALHATFLSVADEKLRSDLQTALAKSERGFITRIAASWEQLAGLLGYRLRPEVQGSFEMIASLASATLRGLVIMALSTPETASRRIQARPFGAARAAEWSPVALTTASIAFAFLEPDPAIEWNGERLAEARRALGELGTVPA